MVHSQGGIYHFWSGIYHDATFQMLSGHRLTSESRSGGCHGPPPAKAPWPGRRGCPARPGRRPGTVPAMVCRATTPLVPSESWCPAQRNGSSGLGRSEREPGRRVTVRGPYLGLVRSFQNICDLDILRIWHFKIFVQKSKNMTRICYSELFAYGISMSSLWYMPS